MCCEWWTEEFKNPYVHFYMAFHNNQNCFPPICLFIQCKICHKSLLMSASTNSALHVWTYWISSYWDPSNIVRGGQNPVNPLFIHHTIPHISVEPSQPYSTLSTPRCFKSFPSPAPRRRRFALNIFICYPGYQETDSMALIRVEEVQISEPEREMETGAKPEFLC